MIIDNFNLRKYKNSIGIKTGHAMENDTIGTLCVIFIDPRFEYRLNSSYSYKHNTIIFLDRRNYLYNDADDANYDPYCQMQVRNYTDHNSIYFVKSQKYSQFSTDLFKSNAYLNPNDKRICYNRNVIKLKLDMFTQPCIM